MASNSDLHCTAAQQDEIDNLYDQLDDQRNEIRRLQEQLSRYGGPQFSDDDPEMNALINEIEIRTYNST